MSYYFFIGKIFFSYVNPIKIKTAQTGFKILAQSACKKKKPLKF